MTAPTPFLRTGTNLPSFPQLIMPRPTRKKSRRNDSITARNKLSSSYLKKKEECSQQKQFPSCITFLEPCL